jgi:hypothetical protein
VSVVVYFIPAQLEKTAEESWLLALYTYTNTQQNGN